ncbi:MAG TPA: hypothetical protein VN892_05985 [Solirubrobacteraceae bacterium]|nr:hypothetical protein [Solirubrobacteraceae bacterium]
MTTSDPKSDERKQTTPTGAVIPVPKRKEVMRDLRKVAHPPKPKRPAPDEDSEGSTE